MVRILLATLPLLLAPPARADSPSQPLKLYATAASLPKTVPCGAKAVRATVLYRVEQVLAGTYREPTVLVVQRCPELARGPAAIGRGTAGPVRVGQTYLLELGPLAASTGPALVDPFVDDPRPRYRALRTDHSDWPPHLIAVLEGGGGTHLRLPFDAGRIAVGRAADNDLMLHGSAVALHHLSLLVRDGAVQAVPLGTAQIRVNGRSTTRSTRITFRDRLGIGSYTLRVALFRHGARE